MSEWRLGDSVWWQLDHSGCQCGLSTAWLLWLRYLSIAKEERSPFFDSLLGLFLYADSTAYSSAHFGQNSAVIIALDDVACTVYESRLIDCPYDSHIADCTHSEDAGVQCVPSELLRHRYVNFCLWHSTYLTGCSHGSIRLRDSTGSMNGRVEVCLNGDWGTVCHDRWSTVDSNIACRQLGFSNSGIFPLCVNFNIVYVHTRIASHWIPIVHNMFTCRFHCI